MPHRFLFRFIGITAIIILAVILRFWQVDSIPPGFHLDESYQGLEAWRILTEPDYHPFYLRDNFGPLPANAYLNVLAFWLANLVGAEPGPVTMRMTAALVGVLTVVSIFGLASELRRYPSRVGYSTGDHSSRDSASSSPESLNHGVLSHRLLNFSESTFSPAFPLFAAAILATMRWHIHFSRMGIESIYVPLIWTLAIWSMLYGWRTGKWLGFILSGVTVGIGMYTYRGAWVIPLIVLLLIVHLRLGKWHLNVPRMQNTWSRIWRYLVWGSILFLVVSPLIWFYINQPSLFLVRLEQVNIVGNTGSPADDTIWTNLGKMAQMFGPFGAVGDLDPRRNLPGAAALSWPFALFFYVGVGVSLWRIRHPAYALLLCGLALLLLPGVFSEYAPHFHRVFGASAPAALLCAVGLDRVWTLAQAGVAGLYSLQIRQMAIRVAIRGAAVAMLLMGGFFETTDYFRRWATMSSLYHAFDVGLWEMGNAIAAESPEASIYISPRGLSHPTLAFAWEIEHPRTTSDECVPLSFDVRHIFPLRDGQPEQPEYYAVIEHEDFRTPLLLPGVLPEHTIAQEFLDYEGGVYGRIYKRTPVSKSPRVPQIPVDVMLGDGIRLLGYDIQPDEVQRGEILYLQLHWLVEESPANDWTVFTHVRTLSPESPERVAGYDSKPGDGSFPMPCWAAGQRILDEYQIQLPDDLAPEEYQLYIGLYQPTGEQLPADGNGLRLGTVQVFDSPD